jgi:pilus assembly protein CpaD
MLKTYQTKPVIVPLALMLSLAVTGCKHMEPEQVMGWSLIDAAQRHPIMVTQAPTHLDLEILRGRSSLTPEQRASVIDFMRRYKKESTTGKLVIAAPSGAPNEVSAVSAAGVIRNLARAEGLGWSQIETKPYTAEDGNPMPPVRLSFVKQTAEGPECGRFPANLASDSRNLPAADFGCTTQANLAAAVDNPQDLLTPRTEQTPRLSERRDVVWEKFNKGEQTGARKSDDEKVKVKEQ